jgi:PucR C-terminal helix-turn-helix domain/GGDEF-like domain
MATRCPVNRATDRQANSLQQIRAELAALLRERFAEIEEAILARVRSVFEPDESDDLEYRAGLRAAVAESVNFALTVIERGEEPEPMPEGLAGQARRAARNKIRLDTLLRRYAAGERLMGEFIMEEADRFPSEAVRQILRAQGPHVDRLMASVAAEYMDELELMKRSSTQRLAERVQRLLAGEAPLDLAEFKYEFGGWHLGLVVTGEGAEAAARTLAAGLNRQVLVVSRGDHSAWAWLGGRRHLAVAEVERFFSAGVLGEVSLAVGEPRKGVNGWRLTHHEAQAARLVMLRRPQKLTRAGDVILLAAVLRDDSLAKSLRETYLAPLDEHGDSGSVLRETLRAYFAAGFNAATAAAALEVDRHTVQRRLRKVEEALGRLLHACHAELAVALSLEQLDRAGSPSGLISLDRH